MKYMAEALGIEYEDSRSNSVTVIEANPPATTEQAELENNGTNYDDLNEMVHKAKIHGLSLLEAVETYELKNRPRIYEVANQLLTTAMAGIKIKHSYEFKHKDHQLKAGSKSSSTGGNNNTQINNFFGTRDEILEQVKMLMNGDKNEES